MQVRHASQDIFSEKKLKAELVPVSYDSLNKAII